jgi:hypothetical protein
LLAAAVAAALDLRLTIVVDLVVAAAEIPALTV